MVRALNAAMESWFGSVKSEIGEHFESVGDARKVSVVASWRT
jgi:hypothetical protein